MYFVAEGMNELQGGWDFVTIVSIIFIFFNGKCISFFINKEPFYIQFETLNL